MTHNKIERFIYNLITTSTGTSFLDSGGVNGRKWQQNQKKTIEDFKKEPEAVMEFDQPKYGYTSTVSAFHYLTTVLDLDDICDQYNDLDCDDWDGNEFYGVSAKQEQWLLERFEKSGDNFNTYNWECILDHVLQGCLLYCKESRDEYVLLQVHLGADVRGGYTDAYLFKVDCDLFLDIGTMFTLEIDDEIYAMDYMGEWINYEGRSVDDQYYQKIYEHLKKEHKKDSFEVECGMYYSGM